MRFLLTLLLVTPAALVAYLPQSATVEVAARSVQPGEVLLVTIAPASPVSSVTVRAFDRDFAAFAVSETRWQALVGIDLDVAPGRHRLTIASTGAAGVASATHEVTVAPKSFPTRRLTVEPQYVEPPAEVTARIVREAERLNAIWATRTPTRLWHGAFVPPVPDRPNSAFGSRSIFNGQPRSPHGGADFASPTGRPIRAPAGGRVVLAEDLYFTGQTVVLDHGLGLVSLFAHLSAIDTSPGATVAPGDVVGRVGATGRVTGPHLHWTVRLAGSRVDPLSLIHVTGPTDASASSATGR